MLVNTAPPHSNPVRSNLSCPQPTRGARRSRRHRPPTSRFDGGAIPTVPGFRRRASQGSPLQHSTWGAVAGGPRVAPTRLVRYWVILSRFFYPIPRPLSRHLYGGHPAS